MGRRAPAERAEDGAALCLAPAAVARRKRGPDRNPARRLRVAALGRRGRCRALRAASGGLSRARGARPLAWRGAGRRRRRAVCRCGDSTPRRVAPAGHGARDRRGPGGGPARRRHQRARGARGPGAVARAPPRAADARAVPLRPPIRGARGVPRRALGARGTGGRGARRGVAPAPGCDPRARPRARCRGRARRGAADGEAPAAAARNPDCCCWSPRPFWCSQA